MKFNMLTESEMIQQAKSGNHIYLDLLLSKYEQLLLQHISNVTTDTTELLTIRQDCISYIHTHFYDRFNPCQHIDFATWLLKCAEKVVSKRQKTNQ